MNARNYQKELEGIIDQLVKQGGDCEAKKVENWADDCHVPTLFLHSCCAPCSSYVLEYLCKYFKITVFYYNPNISASEEYRHRVEEQKRLIAAYNDEKRGYEIGIVEGDYEPALFYEAVKGLEHLGEGSERCFHCFDLRLRETYNQAVQGKFDYFTTTLTISPLKNAQKLNEIGESLVQGEAGPKWLPGDFKKKNGYKRSVELSAEYDLYRQDFCGCSFSKAERLR